MQNPPAAPITELSPSTWSNRIILAAAAGILFLTFYPFRFAWHVVLPGNHSPFLLGHSGKSAGPLDAFLNVLLFMPLGFGLFEKFREKGKSRIAALLLVLLTGALLSYTIEFVQIYIPPRDSGWEDIWFNSLGAVAGGLLFEASRGTVPRLLLAFERALAGWISANRAALLLLIYFAAWFAASVFLQRETGLTNWLPDAQLLVGNEAAGRLAHAWKGRVFRLQLWDRAFPEQAAQKISAGEAFEGARDGLLADYDFSAAPPIKDRKGFLPDLSWTPHSPPNPDPQPLQFDGTAWLSSKIPVAPLVADLKKTDQFSLLLVCAPSQLTGSDARIVSISDPSGLVNLHLRQEDTDLVFWFRNGLSVRRAQLAWYVPNTFSLNQTHTILYSYDGSNLFLFLDGKEKRPPYRLSPGTALAQSFRHVKPSELEGYDYIYYALAFLPAGALLGLAARKLGLLRLSTLFLLAAGFLLPPLVLERILMSVSGRPFSSANIVLSLFCALAASLWINADPRPRPAPPRHKSPSSPSHTSACRNRVTLTLALPWGWD
jgi:hypothetical protein